MVETNYDGFSYFHRWSSQVTRWAEHGVEHIFGRFCSWFKLGHLFPFANNELARLCRKGARLFAAEFSARGYGLFRLYGTVIQKLGRFSTARSTLAEIVPRNGLCHTHTLSENLRPLFGKIRLVRVYVRPMKHAGFLLMTTLFFGCGYGGDDDEGGDPNVPDITGQTTLGVTCTAGGSNVCPGAYGIEGIADPTIQLVRGETYTFNVSAGANHPFYIKTVGGNANTENTFDDGVVGQGATQGTLTFTVPATAPDQLFYQCSVHAGMTGSLLIVDPA